LLHRVSLAVAAGERWAVTGPTGSGKTLLLRALALLDPVDDGEVLWRGKRVADRDVPSFRRQVVYLQQHAALIEGTVETNLRLPFQFKVNRELSFDRRRCVSQLNELNLGAEFLEKKSADLSGGETQITAILRALQLAPALLLLDEPTAALDAQSTALVERLVSGWFNAAQRERAVVWVTHNAEQSERVAEQRLSLQAGKVVWQ